MYKVKVRERRREEATDRGSRERYTCVHAIVDAFICGRETCGGHGSGGMSYINKHRTATEDGRELLIKG